MLYIASAYSVYDEETDIIGCFETLELAKEQISLYYEKWISYMGNIRFYIHETDSNRAIRKLSIDDYTEILEDQYIIFYYSVTKDPM